MIGSVISFSKAEDAERPIDGDYILDYLEAHVAAGISELSCTQVLRNADIGRLDAFFRNHHTLVNLKCLKLPRNDLSEESTGSLARIVQQTTETLVELDLSYNPLRAAGLAAIVNAITNNNGDENGGGAHSRLERLDLTSTHIGPTGLAMASLECLVRHNDSIRDLQLGHNNLGTKTIKTFSNVLCNENTTIEILGLAYNRLKDRGAGFVSQALDPNLSNCRLTCLDLSGNGIGPTGAKQVASALLSGNTRLIRLDLGLNTIGPDGASSMGSMLKFTHSLEQLILTGNRVGDDGVENLSEGLGGNVNSESRLQRLELDWNGITNVGAGHLAQVLLGKNSVLKSLNLANNSIGDIGIIALAEAIPFDLTLLNLDLSSNQMGDASAAFLAKVLCRPKCQVELRWGANTTLTTAGIGSLDQVAVFRRRMQTWLGWELEIIEERRSVCLQLLHHGNIGDAEFKALSNHLAKYRPTVTAMYARGQGISSESIQQLSKQVLTNNAVNLQRIYLQNTEIADVGAGLLAQALPSNSALTVLSLTACNISHLGAQKLANGLCGNSTISRLDLKQNRIGDQGLQAILAAIEKNPTLPLVSVNAGSNGIHDYGLSTLRSFAQLEELHLANNNITDRGALDLAKVLLEEHTLQWLTLRGNRLTTRGIQALSLFFPSTGILDSTDQRNN